MIEDDDDGLPRDGRRTDGDRRRSRDEVPEPDGWRPLGYEW